MNRIMARWFAPLLMLGLVLAACGGTPTPAANPTAAAEAPTAAPSPTPIIIVDPNAVTADPNKVQIRWFVGLGTGTDPEQVPIEEKVVEAFNASHPKIQLILE